MKGAGAAACIAWSLTAGAAVPTGLIVQVDVRREVSCELAAEGARALQRVVGADHPPLQVTRSTGSVTMLSVLKQGERVLSRSIGTSTSCPVLADLAAAIVQRYLEELRWSGNAAFDGGTRQAEVTGSGQPEPLSRQSPESPRSTRDSGARPLPDFIQAPTDASAAEPTTRPAMNRFALDGGTTSAERSGSDDPGGNAAVARPPQAKPQDNQAPPGPVDAGSPLNPTRSAVEPATRAAELRTDAGVPLSGRGPSSPTGRAVDRPFDAGPSVDTSRVASADRTDGGAPRETTSANRTDGGAPREPTPANRTDSGAPRETTPANRTEGGAPQETTPANRTDGGPPRETTPENRTDGGTPREMTPENRTDSGASWAPRRPFITASASGWFGAPATLAFAPTAELGFWLGKRVRLAAVGSLTLPQTQDVVIQSRVRGTLAFAQGLAALDASWCFAPGAFDLCVGVEGGALIASATATGSVNRPTPTTEALPAFGATLHGGWRLPLGFELGAHVRPLLLPLSKSYFVEGTTASFTTPYVLVIAGVFVGWSWR